jgi:Zn-dependent protease with chaperone function
MSSGHNKARQYPQLPLAFWTGLGVPFAIVLTGLWQWERSLACLSQVHTDSYSYWGGNIFDCDLILHVLASLTLTLGVLAALVFSAGLAALRHSSIRVRQSRQALLKVFELCRRLLPIFMMLQTLLMFAGLSCLSLFEAIYTINHGWTSNGYLLQWLGLLALGLPVLFAYLCKIALDTIVLIHRKQHFQPIEIVGKILLPQQAPKLWDFVREVATQAGTRMPDSIVVGLNEVFFVTEHPVMLIGGRSVPKGRVLYLPLPYLAFLKRAEAAAVVAHELGHLTGEDTRYGLRFMPIYSTIEDSIDLLAQPSGYTPTNWRIWFTAPASLYGKWFLAIFDEAMHHWSREREFAADVFSKRVAGPDTAAVALLRSILLCEIVEEVLERNSYARFEHEGVLPMVRRLVAERGLPDPRDYLEMRQTDPLDTHPPFKQRLDALGVSLTADFIARVRKVDDTHLLAELGLEDQQTQLLEVA